MREELSRDPIAEGQRKEMFFELVQKPNAIIEARDEPFTAEAKKSAKSTNNKQQPSNQHGKKSAKTSQKKDHAALMSTLDHLWYMTKLDILDLSNDTDDWRSINLDRIQPSIDITLEEIKKRTSWINVDQNKMEEGLISIFKDLGDAVCKGAQETTIRGDLVFKISGIFEALRFRLSDLCEKVLIEQEDTTCQI
jgi:hypothetical protein